MNRHYLSLPYYSEIKRQRSSASPCLLMLRVIIQTLFDVAFYSIHSMQLFQLCQFLSVRLDETGYIGTSAN